MGNKGNLTTVYLLPVIMMCCCLEQVYAQAPGQAGDEAVAVVRGERVITLKEIDEQIWSQIYPLQEKIYLLRKAAVENLLNKVLLEKEARSRGLSVEALRSQLISSDVKITQSQIDQFYYEHMESFGTLSEEEAKQRIRLDFESREKLEKFKAALAEMKKSAQLSIFLPHPEPPIIKVNSEGPSKGPEEALVTVVEFSDFQCPYCKITAKTLEQLLQAYRDKVRLVYKHSPIPTHPMAFKAAQASVCAAKQGGFWPFHDRLFASTDLSIEALKRLASELELNAEQFDECLESPASRDDVLKDIQEAKRVNVQGTPTLFINGRVLRGAITLDAFKQVIEQEIERVKRQSNR